MISPVTTFVAISDQISTQMSEETVILNLQTGVYYGLDPVGSFIWQLLQSPTDIDTICAALLSEYDVEPQRARQDVIRLINHLMEEGLIVTTAPN